jgi:hypothetical protein
MATLVMRARNRVAALRTTYGNSDDALDQHGPPPSSENPCFPAKSHAWPLKNKKRPPVTLATLRFTIVETTGYDNG